MDGLLNRNLLVLSKYIHIEVPIVAGREGSERIGEVSNIFCSSSSISPFLFLIFLERVRLELKNYFRTTFFILFFRQPEIISSIKVEFLVLNYKNTNTWNNFISHFIIFKSQEKLSSFLCGYSLSLILLRVIDFRLRFLIFDFLVRTPHFKYSSEFFFA